MRAILQFMHTAQQTRSETHGPLPACLCESTQISQVVEGIESGENCAHKARFGANDINFDVRQLDWGSDRSERGE